MPVPLTPYLQYLTSNGLPRAGGKVYTYAAGTLTPKATFTTADGTVQAANPVILNSAGVPDHGSGNTGMIWIQGSYDFVVTNADGTDPITIPNQTSFNTIAAAGASYFQSFSGDGTTTNFALSQPLGTDENAVLFFVDNGLVDFITNGNFATDTVWNKGAGWTIGSGVATATGAISTSINQNANANINAGQSYTIIYTITRSVGTITPNVGGTLGTARSASGTYTETIIAGASQSLGFDTAGFTGTLDNVSVKLVESQGWQVVPPTAFTLNNTSITFASAPRAGTNNIIGFAFSTLVAAASASAAAAEAFANAANVSATNAAASASSLTGTSTSSVAIGTGSKSFTTQTGKNFYVGQFISVSSNATPTNYMFGQVTSYNTLTGALVVNVTDTGGTGTAADWNISVSGIKGPAGTVTPSNNSITYPMFTSGVIASVSDIINSVASKIINAANFKGGLRGLESYTLLSSQTASASSSINFTSLITSEFDEYILTFQDVGLSVNGENLLLRTSTNNGTSYDAGASDYGRAGNTNASGSATTTAFVASVATAASLCPAASNAAGNPINGKVTLFNPLGTTMKKTGNFTSSCYNTGATDFLSTRGDFVRVSTAGINAVQFLPSSGVINVGVFRMYGVRKV